MSNSKRLAFFIIILAVLAGCNQTSTPKETPTPAEALSEGAVYPHSEDFKKNSHGAVFRKDREVCAKCHAKDFSGGTTKVSCQNCHAGYPHSRAWAGPSNHGKFFAGLDPENIKKCQQCHSGESPTSGISCKTCHQAYPHDDEFRGGAHGDFAKIKEGKCTACHRGFKENMPNFTDGCVTCHSDENDTEWKTTPTPTPAPIDNESSRLEKKVDGDKKQTAKKEQIKLKKRIPSSSKVQ